MNEKETLDLILTKIAKIDAIEKEVAKIDAIEKKVAKIDAIEKKVAKIDAIEKKVAKIDAIEKKIATLDNKFCSLENKVDTLDNKFDTMQKDMTNIKIVLENEIRVNIQRIAEGHLDLARNLNEAKKPNAEVENLTIKVNMLQTDVRELKQRIS